MNPKAKFALFSAILAVCLIISVNPLIADSPITDASFYPATQLETSSYVIFKDGAITYAKEGDSGAIPYSGTNESLVFQNAIDDLSATGGEILIRSGVYDLDSALLMYNDIKIKGEGWTTILRDTNFTAPPEGGIFYNYQTDEPIYRVEITDLQIDLQNASKGGWGHSGIRFLQPYDCNFERLWIRNIHQMYGIMIYGGSRNNIRNNWFSNYTGISSKAVYLQSHIGNTRDNEITGNLIESMGGYGIVAKGRDADTYNSSYNTISDNIIDGGTVLNAGEAIIVAREAHHNIVTDNVIKRWDGVDILLDGVPMSPTNVRHNVVSHNTIEGRGTLDGILITAGCVDNEISSNIINNVTTYGIKIADLTWGGNNYTSYNNFVTGNIISNAPIGIYDQLIYTPYESRSIITNNVITNCTTPIMSNGSISVIEYNVGFATETEGRLNSVSNGTILAHGLAGTPDSVVLTPHSNVVVWCQARNATHITFGVASGTPDIDYSMKYIP